MKFLVVGCGSIGKRHLGNLKYLSAGELTAYDAKPETREEVGKKYGITTFPSFEEAMWSKPDAVLVCTPSSGHMGYAMAAVDADCCLFIEKPISHTTEGIDELISAASAKGLAVLVGCNFRFDWGLQITKKLVDEGRIGRLLCARVEFGQYLPDWHPLEDYRHGYSANKALGGGIILDAIHEINYIQWFMGEVQAVSCLAKKLSSLEIDTEDIAEILLRFKNGTIAEPHLDYLQRSYNRSCELIGEEGTIVWSFQDKQVRLYSAGNEQWRTYEADLAYDVNDMYVSEMKHFLRCISGEEQPLVGYRQGKYDLEVALAARKSSVTGQVINLYRGGIR